MKCRINGNDIERLKILKMYSANRFCACFAERLIGNGKLLRADSLQEGRDS
jgi:hypothetical protein